MVVAGRDAGREFTVAGEGSLGRSSNAAVGLTDADVSRRHARVYTDAESRHWVEDLGSRNGTFVNGARISRIRLEYGDKLRLGRWTVLLLVQHDAIEDQLLTRQRLEAVGRLALGIAHDFNNMVSALTTSLDFVTSGPPTVQSQSEVEECLDDMQTATTRAAALAARLLRAARRESGPHVEVDLTALCEEVVQIARRTLERDIEIETNIATGIAVRGDPTALHQALMNLWLNARDAMPDGGKLSVSAQAGAVGDRAPRGRWTQTIQTSGGGTDEQAPPALERQVTITVTDTGVGIEPQTMPHVFEPFFTTKADGVGFGVGLASVKEIVTRHGGSVQVDSHVGQGTTFEVILPLATATHPSAGPAPALPDRRPVPQGTRILLADDENVVRRSLVRVLRQAGYLVLEATDGQEAVRVWTE
ncbi:MAG: FHA domain-containing protein, partial [Deltaproteobacteria bacterium]|nr:FHA domain-containing protein [Deltaproteobacteria bacterium]